MVSHCKPSGDSRPGTGSPSSSTIVTAPSTPSSALTVTGDSTLTPTAPSLTDAASLGTNRSWNGVPLSLMTWGVGGAALLLQAPSPSKMAGTSAATTHQARRLCLPFTEPPCHILCSIFEMTTLRTNDSWQ